MYINYVYTTLFLLLLKIILGTPLVLQWLILCASTAGDTCSIPGRGTKISHAKWHSQNF